MVVVGAIALLLNIGCYSFQRPTTLTSPVGGVVRLTLTPQGTTELARFLGPRVVSAEGTLASIRADGALVVGVDWVAIEGGQRQPWTGEGLVTFPRDMVAGVDQRTFDRKKSVIAALVVTAGLAVIAAIALAVSGSQSSAVPVGGPPPP